MLGEWVLVDILGYKRLGKVRKVIHSRYNKNTYYEVLYQDGTTEIVGSLRVYPVDVEVLDESQESPEHSGSAAPFSVRSEPQSA